jgi:Uma2 family endonuclease
MSANNPTLATTEKTIQQLIRSPRLPLVMQQLQSILQAEQEKRQRFYKEISETQKAEFINGEVKAQAFTRDQTKFPVPDLVVEILSDSTEAIDRGVKVGLVHQQCRKRTA